MENIFEGAKFGDKFVMRNGEFMVFVRRNGCSKVSLIDDRGDMYVYEIELNGVFDSDGDSEEYDIVSRVKEQSTDSQ